MSKHLLKSLFISTALSTACSSEAVDPQPSASLPIDSETDGTGGAEGTDAEGTDAEGTDAEGTDNALNDQADEIWDRVVTAGVLRDEYGPGEYVPGEEASTIMTIDSNGGLSVITIHERSEDPDGRSIAFIGGAIEACNYGDVGDVIEPLGHMIGDQNDMSESDLSVTTHFPSEYFVDSSSLGVFLVPFTCEPDSDSSCTDFQAMAQPLVICVEFDADGDIADSWAEPLQ